MKGRADISDYLCILADHGEIPRSFPAHLSVVFANFVKTIISSYNELLTSREQKDEIIKQLLASVRILQDLPPGARFGATLFAEQNKYPQQATRSKQWPTQNGRLLVRRSIS
jgi:hypothetical protein